MKLNKKQIKNTKKIFKYFVLIFMFYVAYAFGNVHGVLSGVNVVIEREDIDICEFLDLEKEDGYCILSEEAKYNQEVSCYFGDFKVKGGTEPTGVIKGVIASKTFIFGNILLRCWG